MTASAETVIHASKSTDFIKPKGSSSNLEAQNPGMLTHSLSVSHSISKQFYCNGIEWASQHEFYDFSHFIFCFLGSNR